MKLLKKIGLSFIILIIFLLGIIFLTPVRYCTFPRDGGGGTCDNIEDSKFIGVFLWQYEPEKREILIDNRYKFKIEEVWIEKLWVYTRDFRYPKPFEYKKAQCRMIISTGANNLGKHGIFWRFDGFGHQYTDYEYGNLLVKEMKWYEAKDTISVRIFNLEKKEGAINDSIGIVRFFRVNK